MSSSADDPATAANGHVLEAVADYVCDRMEPSQARMVRAHLRACAACADAVRWATQLHASAHAVGAHLGTDRIAALSSAAQLSPTESAHLKSCAACRHELEILRELAEPAEARVAEARATATRATATDNAEASAGPARGAAIRSLRRRRPWLRPSIWGASALAVAAALLLLIHPNKGELDALRALARVEALPAHVSRAPAQAGSFEEAWQLGLEAYANEDYAAAAGQLARASTLRPNDAQALLFLGSARLLAQDATAAVAALRQALPLTQHAGLTTEIRWQLAQAQLAAGNPDGATATLQELLLVNADGSHAGEARELLGRIQQLQSSH